MERYRVILSAVLAAGAVGLSGAAVYTSLTAVPALSSQPLAETEKLAPEDTAYLLVAEEGYLCVYQGDELVMRTSIPVALLPEADQNDLESGIRAETRQELAALLEDFGA